MSNQKEEMYILIIGLGSIAIKHIMAIRTILPAAHFVALRFSKSSEKVAGVENIYSWDHVPKKLDFIIISNPTQLHKEAIAKSLSFNCPIFIEKPLLSAIADGEELLTNSNIKDVMTYVGCNLRFHPSLIYLKKLIEQKALTINEVNVYCGSDLTQWRPHQDYTKTYSASAAMGGGVHLDLIHEIDYCYWLFGKPVEVRSIRRKVSSLKIDSYDFAAYTLIYADFTVNITLNYYRKATKRTIEVVAEEKIIVADLTSSKIAEDEISRDLNPSYSIADTYLDQMSYFIRHVKTKEQPMNNFTEAFEVLKMSLQ